MSALRFVLNIGTGVYHRSDCPQVARARLTLELGLEELRRWTGEIFPCRICLFGYSLPVDRPMEVESMRSETGEPEPKPAPEPKPDEGNGD